MKITVTTTGAAEARDFLLKVEGTLRRPRALHADLADALKDELIRHFDARNQEPNKRGWPKSNFWQKAASLTRVKEVTDTGATVQVAGDANVRIHLLGGTVKPTGGRKWLTIPLIPEARGKRASVYEAESGRKLFRPAGRRVLMERLKDGSGDAASGRASMRTKGGYRTFNLGAVKVRPVYALATEAKIPKDPRALPPRSALADALQTAANDWAARELAREAKRKGGSLA